MNSIDLRSASWKDVKETRYDAVILPWGAFEPHNYHLPYLTDCYLSHHIALDSAEFAYDRSGVLCCHLFILDRKIPDNGICHCAFILTVKHKKLSFAI